MHNMPLISLSRLTESLIIIYRVHECTWLDGRRMQPAIDASAGFHIIATSLAAALQATTRSMRWHGRSCWCHLASSRASTAAAAAILPDAHIEVIFSSVGRDAWPSPKIDRGIAAILHVAHQ